MSNLQGRQQTFKTQTGTTSRNCVTTNSRESSKMVNQQAVSLHDLANTATLNSSSNNNGVLQSVPMFQTAGYEDGVLGQNSQGQTFLLTSSGTVLASNNLASQEELVGVYLPTSTAGYTTVNSDNQQYVSTSNSLVQNVNQGQRLILQQGSNSIPQSALSTPGHYLIQVGSNSAQIPSNSNNVCISKEGHIVIKSGSAKVKTEPLPETPSPSSDGVFRVVIRDGTTKITKPSSPHNDVQQNVQKQIQMNVTDQPQLRVPTYGVSPAVQPVPQTTSAEKVHECSNCGSKFMRPLYLRLHKRSCRKAETKQEKLPLFMCSFCKCIFKTKPQIHQHFSHCSLNPSPIKQDLDDTSGTEVDPALEAAIQYKCSDCERTFNKERQFTSHVKRCTKVSFNDLSGARVETGSEELQDEGHDNNEDPFADPPMPHASSRRSRGASGRRGRPPRRSGAQTKSTAKSNVLFDGPSMVGSSNALMVVDNENLVRSTTGLAHTVQLTLETAMMEQKPLPNALITDNKGVKGKGKMPQAWSLVCSLCKKMFLSKSSLASHMIQQHGNDLSACRNILYGFSTIAKELFKCPLCLLHYQSEKDFLQHLVLKHTTKLQNCYSNLQLQKGSFVCSLCSIVMTTRSLLIEHISLEHLDELQTCANKVNRTTAAAKAHDVAMETDDSWDEPIQPSLQPKLMSEKVPLNDSNALECCFCGEVSPTQEILLKHYVDVHEVETDVDGCVLDLGVDVDIKVKDTKSLLQMADSKIHDGAHTKTVLMKKQPKQSWQCHNCQQVFQRQVSFSQHMRDGCAGSSHDVSKASNNTDNHFFCHQSQCSHLSFQQVKSLFKHMEEAHNIAVPKERKTFATLSDFQQWLEEESAQHGVQFVTENSRVEKGDVKLVQMVCQRFHATRANEAREKEAELSKPTKKRLYVRTQRNGDCHARIHLRIAFDPTTNHYDANTQMIYYPQHLHVIPPNKRTKSNGVLEEPLVLGTEIPSSVLHMMKTDPTLPTANNGTTFDCHAQSPSTTYIIDPHKKDHSLVGTYLMDGGDTVAQGSPHVVIKDQNFVLQDGLVVDVNPECQSEPAADYGEEYVLPADESEWSKLFDVLKARLTTQDLMGTDRKDAVDLMTYQGVTSIMPLHEQVSIFQKLCSLTNTSLGSL